MPRITVVVAATSPDIIAAGIAAGVAARDDMTLAQGRVVTLGEVDALLETAAPSLPCALILVGPQTETANRAECWLAARPGLVAVCVGSPIGDIVRITLKNIGLSELLAELRSLVDHGDAAPRERVAHVELRPAPPAPAPHIGGQDTAPSSERTAVRVPTFLTARHRTLNRRRNVVRTRTATVLRTRRTLRRPASKN